MSLSTSDKRWMRKMVREVLAEVIAEEAVSQLGGYDGRAVVDEDETEGRIGFHISHRSDPKPKQ